MRLEKQNLKRQNQNNPNKSSSTDSPYSQVSKQVHGRGCICAILSYGGAVCASTPIKSRTESLGQENVPLWGTAPILLEDSMNTRDLRDQKEPDQIDSEPRFSDAFEQTIATEIALMDNEFRYMNNLHYDCLSDQEFDKDDKMKLLNYIAVMMGRLRTIRNIIKVEATDE
jgi:hypothetical protein